MRTARFLSRLSTTFMIALACAHGLGQTPGPSEYQVKAAFLYNFVKFVEWPAEALTKQEGMVLCVFGKDPFNGELDQATQGKSVDGRKLAIHRINDPVAAISCHVLFVGASEPGRSRAVISAVRNFAVLTVTETDRRAEGGMINFLMDGQRVRFQIDAKAAARVGLKISSKLLQVAVGVTEERAGR
jgi:hypothetical protein